MTTAEKIKEGCGKRTDFENNGLTYNLPICSFGNLCSTCQARLSQYKSDLQQELAWLMKLKKEMLILEDEIVDGLEDGQVSVLKRINLIEKELENIEK